MTKYDNEWYDVLATEVFNDIGVKFNAFDENVLFAFKRYFWYPHWGQIVEYQIDYSAEELERFQMNQTAYLINKVFLNAGFQEAELVRIFWDYEDDND